MEDPSDAVVARLAAAGCVAPTDEATELVSTAPDEQTLETWLQRRERGEPLAWITGRSRFCGQVLRVRPGVYVPRAQTELLARRAAAVLPAGGRAIDLCTGAGAIACHLRREVPGASVVGTDSDLEAARCASSNGVATVVTDLAAGVRGDRNFDVVTAVAPYVPTGALRLLPTDVQRHEPRLAHDGGPDGLDLVRRVIAAAADLLEPGGWLLIELGGDQDTLLAATLAERGFEPAIAWRDEDGDLRGAAARRT